MRDDEPRPFCVHLDSVNFSTQGPVLPIFPFVPVGITVPRYWTLLLQEQTQNSSHSSL
jgi:hypothetical protein